MIPAIFFAVAVPVFLLLGFTRFARGEVWSATTPPLASIIGSGFLVSAPLLGREFGSYAPLAMLVLLLLAWGLGAAVRCNIAGVEGQDRPRTVRHIDRLSELVLIAAYVISVGYYLVLLGSFAVRTFFAAPHPLAVKAIATALIVLISVLGWSGGLARVIRLEAQAVALKLGIIGGFLAALLAYDIGLWQQGAALAPMDGRFSMSGVPVLLGLLVVVQGFETSRYLGSEYPAAVRVRTMRRAQATAAAIYLCFFVLVLPLLPAMQDGHGETAIIDGAAVVGGVLVGALTLGALASQFSAAAADQIGGAGLTAELSAGHIPLRVAFPVMGAVTVAIVWATDIFGVIALASRAFAVYYALQCAVAVADLRARGEVGIRLAGFTALGLAAAAAAVLGVPAE